MDGEHTGKATIARIGQLCKVTTHTQTKILTTETRIHFSYISALGLQLKLTFIIHQSDDYFQDWWKIVKLCRSHFQRERQQILKFKGAELAACLIHTPRYRGQCNCYLLLSLGPIRQLRVINYQSCWQQIFFQSTSWLIDSLLQLQSAWAHRNNYVETLSSCVFCVTEWHGRSQESGEQVDHVPQGPAHVFSSGGQRHWHTLRRAAWVVFSFMCAQREKADLTDSRLTLAHFFFLLCVLFAEDVFLMSSKDPKNPVIYAVFTTSRYTGLFTVTSKKKKKNTSQIAWQTRAESHLFCCCVVAWRSGGDDIYSASDRPARVISSAFEKHTLHISFQEFFLFTSFIPLYL